MKTIITIVESPSMPGVFTGTLKNTGRRPIHIEAGRDPAAAAAKAIDLALHHGRHGYAIFAPKKVLDYIPIEFRSNN